MSSSSTRIVSEIKQLAVQHLSTLSEAFGNGILRLNFSARMAPSSTFPSDTFTGLANLTKFSVDPWLTSECSVPQAEFLSCCDSRWLQLIGNVITNAAMPDRVAYSIPAVGQIRVCRVCTSAASFVLGENLGRLRKNVRVNPLLVSETRKLSTLSRRIGIYRMFI